MACMTPHRTKYNKVSFPLWNNIKTSPESQQNNVLWHVNANPTTPNVTCIPYVAANTSTMVAP